MTTSREPELIALRKLAEEYAKQRKERSTTAHLLAAISARTSMAADLLHERRLDREVLLKAARVNVDDEGDAIVRAVQRAREFAARSLTREPGAVHLLFALCQERSQAAYRTIVQCGADVNKLRNAAMQLAMGIAPPRRVPVAQSAAIHPQKVPERKVPESQTKPSSAVRLVPVERVRIESPRTISPKGRRLRSAPGSLVSNVPTADERRFYLDPKAYPTLTQLGRNLTLAAVRGEIDPVIGRDEEIECTLDVLAKRQANNPCLVGAAGVGKTSVVRGIAARIAKGEGTSSLDHKIIIEIEPTQLLAGTGIRGALAERMTQLKGEVQKSEGRVVLFFDEIHTLFGPDAGDEGTSELKLALAKGELPCIGATTYDEYRKIIEADPPLARRFSTIDVDEPSPEDAFLALEGLVPMLEKHHAAHYAKEAIAASVTWSVRYIPSRALPDKAVSILDLVGARARRRGESEITPEQVAEVVSEIAGVPTERLLETDGERMLRMEALMGERIVGHSHQLAKIAAVLRRNAIGFRSRRPLGTFLLLGPTGVGKTETAKAIAECLFYSPDAITRLDLSEYAEAHALARLVGAPPGYIGHEAGGQLTETVRRRPYQVILLDEIEKAHRDVLEGFLQVFDEGRLTDGRGRTIDFSNTVIILTSNLGAEVTQEPKSRGRIGFGARSAGDGVSAYETALIASARAALPPELYNRLDEVLALVALTRADVAEVARRMLVAMAEDLERTRGVRLDVCERAVELLLDLGGFDPDLGARPMRRAIGRHIEAPIAEMLLRGEIRRGDVATIDAEEGALVIDAVTPDSDSVRNGVDSSSISLAASTVA